MSLRLLGIDLGKRSFHIHCIDGDGVMISCKASRAKLIETIKPLAQASIAINLLVEPHAHDRAMRVGSGKISAGGSTQGGTCAFPYIIVVLLCLRLVTGAPAFAHDRGRVCAKFVMVYCAAVRIVFAPQYKYSRWSISELALSLA